MTRILLCLLVLLAALRPARALDWTPQQGEFVFCLLDARDGFWVGTQGDGLWRRDRDGWKQFAAADGLGEETVRCLLERGGQIWVGGARNGLHIWDGAAWKNIGVDNGLPSERVNDLAIDEASGDVWVATENGLCRWNDEGGWTIPDSALAARQIVAVACARGNIWAATACEGLLKSSDRGITWTQTRGAATQPTTAFGDGLPSDVLNDVAVDELGQVWVATIYGLASSNDEGASWLFVRGGDWRDNVKGSADGLQPGADEASVEPPGEDWIQTLATDGDGHLWVGLRQLGAEMRDIQSGELIFATRFAPGRAAGPRSDWARAIAPLANGRAIVGRYGGGGLEAVLDAEIPAPLPAQKAAKLAMPGAFPTLNAAQIAQIGTDLGESRAALWNMDYRTRGDWVGRYGDRLAWIHGTPGPGEYRRDARARIDVSLGSHFKATVGGPYTHTAESSSSNPEVLYHPAVGTRRLAEYNDGTWRKADYPFSWEGPGMWVAADVPAGAHRVALYFYNSDARVDTRGFRDYVLQLKPPGEDKTIAEAAPDLARCRVSDFQGAAYASFAVNGPGRYWIKVGRNRSDVTKVMAAFIDRIGDAPPEATDVPVQLMQGEDLAMRPMPAPIGAESAIVTAARAAWQRLDAATPNAGVWQKRHQLLRAAKAAGADEKLLLNWRQKLALWTDADRAEFNVIMARIEAKRQLELAPK